VIVGRPSKTSPRVYLLQRNRVGGLEIPVDSAGAILGFDGQLSGFNRAPRRALLPLPVPRGAAHRAELAPSFAAQTSVLGSAAGDDGPARPPVRSSS